MYVSEDLYSTYLEPFI